jgi:hypothetical protein
MDACRCRVSKRRSGDDDAGYDAKNEGIDFFVHFAELPQRFTLV